MELGCVSVPLELKFAEAGSDLPAGYFEGYGAVYGNVDRGGDMIEPGACAKSLAQMDMAGVGMPPMYYNHDRSQGTIGVWEMMKEDRAGLFVKGRLIGLDTDQGKMNLARAREGACKGLSIGYRVPPNGSRKGSGRMGEPSRVLKQIDLREVSLVDDPMNPAARLNFVKSSFGAVDEIKTIREFEEALRDFFGFSHSKARTIAERGFREFERGEAAELSKAITGFSQLEAIFRKACKPKDKATFSQDQRDRLAASGAAMPDGSFPIRNMQDLHNAIMAHGRAKDPAAAKRHIIKRARALGMMSELPEGWA